MKSQEAHFTGVKLLQESNPKEAFFSFLNAYEINDANNEYGHLFRMAMTLATLHHFKFSNLLFRQCYYNIKNEKLWLEFLRVMYHRLTNREIKDFSKMCYELQFSSSFFEDYVSILKNIIAFKQLDNKTYDSDIISLNYKLVTKSSEKKN